MTVTGNEPGIIVTSTLCDEYGNACKQDSANPKHVVTCLMANTCKAIVFRSSDYPAKSNEADGGGWGFRLVIDATSR